MNRSYGNMPQDSRFELLRADDNSDMDSMLAQSFAEVFNAEPWNDNWTHQQALERIRDIENTPRFDGTAVIRDGKVIAAILGRGEQYYDGEVFQIIEFWVANAFQRQGIGSRLLADFTEHLKEKGIHKVFLLTMRGERTEGFYKKQGFQTISNMCLMEKRFQEEDKDEI